MTSHTLVIHCCLCANKHRHLCDIPDGWHTDGESDDEWAFCPNHADIADFEASQCPGCVENWGRCTLWKRFGSHCQLSPRDRVQIEAGRCPYRTNGTLVVRNGEGSRDLRLDKPAPSGVGAAFLRAIRDYHDEYHRQDAHCVPWF